MLIPPEPRRVSVKQFVVAVLEFDQEGLSFIHAAGKRANEVVQNSLNEETPEVKLEM